jgi:light-regulated signal transduction histidine kinase (bacteriophytochrome)
MASPSNPIPDPLAEALRENQELRSSLAQLQSEFRQFFYAANHDLQEPLRTVIAYAQLLDRQVASDPVAREYSAFLLNGANHMKDLLHHLVTYSRAGSAKRRAMVNLNVPLHRALLKLAPAIESCSAHIVRNPLPDIVADEAEIAQVFEQLLSNSLKFRSNATPEISIAAEQGTDEYTVILRDNGSGIDPAFCDQVILPFKRLHGKDVPGSGLGLAICDKIIRAHNGRLWVESNGAQGVTVRFTIPL